MIKLRPHHVLCLLRFEGKGYTSDFVKTLTDLIRRLKEGEAITIVEGPDDVCAPLCGTRYWHCENASIYRRDKAARHLIQQHKITSEGLRQDLLKNKEDRTLTKQLFCSQTIQKPCKGCEWVRTCYLLSPEFKVT